jgi:DNA-directed RNA polymerase specialized sigma24 family protein
VTDDELAQLWPRIVSEARRALARYGARGVLYAPEDVAVEAAWVLSRFEHANGAMVAKVTKQRAIDWLRTYGRDGRAKWQPPTEMSLDALPRHEHLKRPDSSKSCAPATTIAEALTLATPGQKKCIIAVIKRNGQKALAARDLRVTRQTIHKHLFDLRLKISSYRA